MVKQHIILQEVEEWAESVNPVFIVGMARSGTTMVYNAFRNNPSFDVPCNDKESPETFLFCSLKMTLPISFNPMTSQYLGGDSNVDSFITTFGNIVSKEKVYLKREGDIIKAVSDTQEYLTNWQKQILAKTFFFTASRLINGKRVIEKTPSHSSHIDDIFKIFPNAKVIHCHRDMVSVMGSIRQRLNKEKDLGHSPEQYDWLNKSVETYVEQYNDAQKAYFDASEKYQGKIIFASYEKIIDDPATEFKRLCEFVDTAFDEKMVQGKRKGHAKWESYSKDDINRKEYDLNGLITDMEIEYIKENSIDMTMYIR